MSAITGFKTKNNTLMSELNKELPTPTILRKNGFKERFMVLDDESLSGFDCWVQKSGDFFLTIITQNDDMLFRKLKLDDVKGIVMKENDAKIFIAAMKSTKLAFREKILNAEKELILLKRDFELELASLSKSMPIKL